MNMQTRIECPYCDGKANLQRESKELTYRKEVFNVVAHFYNCEKCKEEFTTTETDTISLTQAHNLYREKHHIPFPEEIARIRQQYDLSAAKMNEVLGFGANGYSNYENGEIPTPAYGNLISAAADPNFFLSLLEKAEEYFTVNGYKKAREKALSLIRELEVKKAICKRLNLIYEANNLTGFRKLNPERLANLIVYFIKNAKPDFNDKLKLNKLLFFTDFLHYKNHGISISGLSYRPIKLGPVPTNYDNIYSYLEDEQFINPQFQELSNGGVKELFTTEFNFDKSLFTKEEIATLEVIIKNFSNTPTWKIVNLSHQEKAWKELESKKALIGYQDYAFELETI
jgi:putative zinc finger/helix-turn-helix YgiT family protein